MLPVQNCYFCDFWPVFPLSSYAFRCKTTICGPFPMLFSYQNIPYSTGMPPSPGGTAPPFRYTAPPSSSPQAGHSRHTSADTEYIPGTLASQTRSPRSIFRSALPVRTSRPHRGNARRKRTTIQDHSRAPASGFPRKVP